jgi:Ca2+-binding EF-hand superfamily protein
LLLPSANLACPCPLPQIIARNLPASELEELRSMFKVIDADGSGTITIDELRNAVKTMGGGQLGEEQLQVG